MKLDLTVMKLGVGHPFVHSSKKKGQTYARADASSALAID